MLFTNVLYVRCLPIDIGCIITNETSKTTEKNIQITTADSIHNYIYTQINSNIIHKNKQNKSAGKL